MVAPVTFGTFQGLTLSQVASTPTVSAGLELYCDTSNNLHVANSGSDFQVFANPMTTAADLIVGGASGAPARLAKGTANQVLSMDGTATNIVWAASPAGFANPMTTAGDLILGGSSGTPGRLGIGSAGQVLTVSGGTAAWAAATGFANPMTTAGDLIVGGSSGTPARLAIGSTNQVLTVSGGAATWATPAVPSSGGILAGSGVLNGSGTATVTNSFILSSSVVTACYANSATGFNALGITSVSNGSFALAGTASETFFWIAAITPSPNIVYGTGTFDDTGEVTITNGSILSSSTIVATYSSYNPGGETIGVNFVDNGSFVISGTGLRPFFWIAVI